MEPKGDTPPSALHGAAWPDMFESLHLAYAELTQAKQESEERAGQVEEARELFEQVVDSMSDLLLVVDEAGMVVTANHVARSLLGRDDLEGRPLAALLPGDLPATPWDLSEREPGGSLASADLRLAAGGPPRELSVSCGILRDKHGRITGLVVVGRDITERKRAEAAVALLADAGRALAESLDYEETLARVAQLAVPAFADWCIVYVREDQGTIRRVATAAADPHDVELAAVLRDFDIDPDAGVGVSRVIRDAVVEFHPTADLDLLTRDVADPAALRQEFSEISVASWICVPLTAAGQTFGAISFISTRSGRVYRQTDVRIAEELAARGALAIENARAYGHERGMAETLQRSLLPDELPDMPGIALAARYLPAAVAVGGDWYDAIPLGDGSIGLAMGDVAGHGTRAAAVMGQLRNGLRAYALEGHPPSEVLRRLRGLLGEDQMATLVYLVFNPTSGDLRYANAGHPPPVMLDPYGHVSLLPGGGGPLHAGLVGVFRDRACTLAPGSAVVLYTDGLIEVRGESLEQGLDRVSRAVREAAAEDDVERLLAGVLTRLPHTFHDDVAVLVMRVLPTDSDSLELRLPATPEALVKIRRALDRWLASNGVTGMDAFDVQLACGEACANAIEHSYGPSGGHLSFTAERIGDDAVFTIRDFGRWREPRGANRGRGTPIMQATMQRVDVATAPDGTSVRLRLSLRKGAGR